MSDDDTDANTLETRFVVELTDEQVAAVADGGVAVVRGVDHEVVIGGPDSSVPELAGDADRAVEPYRETHTDDT